MRHLLFLALLLVTGCEAVVRFDRSKIDGGNASDGGTTSARVSALVVDDAGAQSRADGASDDEDSR